MQIYGRRAAKGSLGNYSFPASPRGDAKQDPWKLGKSRWVRKQYSQPRGGAAGSTHGAATEATHPRLKDAAPELNLLIGQDRFAAFRSA